jgi:hypothetical protein
LGKDSDDEDFDQEELDDDDISDYDLNEEDEENIPPKIITKKEEECFNRLIVIIEDMVKEKKFLNNYKGEQAAEYRRKK